MLRRITRLEIDQDSLSGINDNKSNPIDYWREKGRWSEEYFKQADLTRKDFCKDFEKDGWPSAIRMYLAFECRQSKFFQLYFLSRLR